MSDTNTHSPLSPNRGDKTSKPITPSVRGKKYDLTGKRKAAIFLVALGSDIAAKIFSHLSDQEVESISFEIAHLDTVDYELKQKVLKEFHDLYSAKRFVSHGGAGLAKEILVKALGVEKAEEIITQVEYSSPLDVIKYTDPFQLFNIIQNEHPQTIALILAHMEPNQASIILSKLDNKSRSDVAKRIAEMDNTSPDVLRSVRQVLEKKISSISSEEYTTAGGIESIVEILNNVDRSTERSIIENLEEEDPELAEDIKRRMFVFEDIVMLDNQAIQRMLHEIDSLDLARALKASSTDVQEKVFSNMSKRAGLLLQEEMEYLGPMRVKDIEDSQQKIVAVIRTLEDKGDIVIARAGEDEIIV